jgi:hypothetical protein
VFPATLVVEDFDRFAVRRGETTRVLAQAEEGE